MPEKSDAGLFMAHQARLMSEQAALLSRLVLVIAVLILAILVTDADGLAHELSAWAFRNLVFGDFIAFSLILALRPRASELTTMAAVILLILGFRRLGLLVGPVAPIAVGTAWLIAILPEAWRGRDYDAARLRFVVFAALLLSAASTLALVGQQLTTWHVKTFDVPAYVTDASYGFSASAVLGRIVWAHPPLHKLLSIVYGWLPAAISTCYVLNVQAGNCDAAVPLKAALAGGAIAFGLYHLYPAAGPAYAFGAAFPARLPDPSALAPVRAVPAVAGAARNCMPSVHFLWALLAVMGACRLRPLWRAGFALFAALTALATIGLGEHYLIDLVVAVPFTVLVLALFNRDRAWMIGWCGTALSGGMLTACWLVFLRIWMPPPHVSPALWLLTATTLAASALLLLGRRSAAASSARQPEPQIGAAPSGVEAE